MAIQIAIAALFMLPVVAFGETDADSPIKTTVCELVKSAARFNGKLISVRAPVQIAFEHFGLSVSECADEKLDDIWLEYGRGPKRQPTISCCGDLVSRDALTLVQDTQFRRFHRVLTATKKTKGCYDYDCYVYRVTATIQGRFDAVETQPCPGDASRHCCSGGFGHFGLTCARIVIRGVSEIVASPIDHH